MTGAERIRSLYALARAVSRQADAAIADSHRAEARYCRATARAESLMAAAETALDPVRAARMLGRAYSYADRAERYEALALEADRRANRGVSL